jgi:hypothetical protein
MAKVTALKEAKREGFSLDDILASAQTTKQAKSSSKTPIAEVPQEIQGKAARIREISEQLDSLKTEFESLSAELVDDLEPVREAYMKRNGYVSTMKVPDGNGLSVSVGWSSMYTKVTLDKAEQLTVIMGDELADYFTKEMEIKVKDVSEEALRDLIQSVGPERFAQFFDVDRWLRPTKRYTEEFYRFEQEHKQQLRTLVRQYKASVKAK